MSHRPQSLTFKIYVLVICAAWAGVLVAVLWGLDWRWIPTALAVAGALLFVGGYVEMRIAERAEQRELVRRLDEAKAKPGWGWWLPRTDEDRDAQRAAIAAEEEAWLGGQDQPR